MGSACTDWRLLRMLRVTSVSALGDVLTQAAFRNDPAVWSVAAHEHPTFAAVGARPRAALCGDRCFAVPHGLLVECCHASGVSGRSRFQEWLSTERSASLLDAIRLVQPRTHGIDAGRSTPAAATIASHASCRRTRHATCTSCPASHARRAAHDSSRALSLLAQRTREFGSWGYFAPEARYLELEAHRLRGDRARARAAARAILDKDPGSPHTDTARSELQGGQR
jgi:hypothetical protein